jgi:hypothetical protein
MCRRSAVQREGFKLTAEWAPDEEEPNGRKKQLTAELVHQILKRISDEDSWTMGYVRLAGGVQAICICIRAVYTSIFRASRFLVLVISLAPPSAELVCALFAAASTRSKRGPIG